MSHPLVFRVVINGDNVCDSFVVDSTSTDTVKQLRRAIKVAIATDQQFRQSSLRDIAIDRLQLWRALLPDPCHCESNFSEFAKDELVLLDILKTKCKLELHQTLGDVFDDHIQLGGKVFIVVKCED